MRIVDWKSLGRGIYRLFVQAGEAGGFWLDLRAKYEDRWTVQVLNTNSGQHMNQLEALALRFVESL